MQTLSQALTVIDSSQWDQRLLSLLGSNQHYDCAFESLNSNEKEHWSFLFKVGEQKIWHYEDPSTPLKDALSEYIGFPINEQASDCLIPFKGGYLVYLAYEYASDVEPSLKLPQTTTFHGYPKVALARCKAAFAYDHKTQTVYAIAETQSELDALASDWLSNNLSLERTRCQIANLNDQSKQRYLDSVSRILQHIHEGDVFQVNLARQWQATLQSGNALDLYAQLRQANPSPMSAFWRFSPDNALLSSSPERLVSVANGKVQTRPIAGTRPRHNDPIKDKQLSDELLNHIKERAEHIMLIDLERNDLGKIAQPGTVEVDELMVLESYAYVHHIVSNVQANVLADISPLDVIHAVFPGGTITGCPKVQCMKIIAEQEQTERGPYTGSLGYINLDGSLDLNILIRTMSLQADTIRFSAGAGIVYDSVAENELTETKHKAQGLIRALHQ